MTEWCCRRVMEIINVKVPNGTKGKLRQVNPNISALMREQIERLLERNTNSNQSVYDRTAFMREHQRRSAGHGDLQGVPQAVWPEACSLMPVRSWPFCTMRKSITIGRWTISGALAASARVNPFSGGVREAGLLWERSCSRDRVGAGWRLEHRVFREAQRRPHRAAYAQIR